jgi:hypothetical protein
MNLSDEEPIFAPGEVCTIEDFVGITLDGWEGALDILRSSGDEKAVEDIEAAIYLLKATYPASETIDLSAYEGQMTEGEKDGPAT